MLASFFPQTHTTVFTGAVNVVPMRKQGRPPTPLAKYPNRLREFRDKRGMTLEGLASQVGYTATTVQRYETGSRQLKVPQLKRFAQVLEVDEAEILGGDEPRIMVLGKAVAGGRIVTAGNDNSIGTVRCPRGLKSERTIAVVAEALPLIPPGWVLYFERPAGDCVPEAALNQLCVLETEDGAHMIRQVRRGYVAGRYNLLGGGLDSSTLDDVALRWAAPMRAILPPDLAAFRS